jgi:hypothetical protein
MQERGGGDVVDLPGEAGLARVTDAAGDLERRTDGLAGGVGGRRRQAGRLGAPR